MELYRVTIPKDDSYKVIEAMGHMGVCHFVDLNKTEQPFNLPYATRIRLCEDAERRLLYLLNKCKEMRIRINRPKTIQSYKDNIARITQNKQKSAQLLFDSIDEEVTNNERHIFHQSKVIADMKLDINKMKDYYEVLDFVSVTAKTLGPNAQPAAVSADIETIGAIGGESAGDGFSQLALTNGGINIAFVAGTIRGGEQDRMNRMIFRVTRGKALTYFKEF
jgi:hypothetical protein